jgi:hypothetical protein
MSEVIDCLKEAIRSRVESELNQWAAETIEQRKASFSATTGRDPGEAASYQIFNDAAQVAQSNIRNVWDQVAPATVDNWLAFLENAVSELRWFKKEMARQARKGLSVSDWMLGPPAPSTPTAAVRAESPPAPTVNVYPQIELKPEIQVNIPATKEIRFVRDPQRNQIMSAEVVKEHE